MTGPRGRCRVCGSFYALNSEGTVRMHKSYAANGRRYDCPGSWAEPLSEPKHSAVRRAVALGDETPRGDTQ